MRQTRRTEPYFLAGILAFAGGCLWVALDSAAWYYGQQYFEIFDQQSILTHVLRYYLAEALAICVTAMGAYLIFRGLRRGGTAPAPDAVRSLIAEALNSPSDMQIGAAVAILYCIIYLMISGILVYQPSVDFRAYYGVSAPSWNAAACCGSPGTVPVLIVYLLPQAHLALQVLPLDALFVVVVPLLVGLNVTVAVHALRNQVLRASAGWMGSVGVLAGLFTGCPTCAGLFLASAVGGFGATTLAVALAPYQVLFVVLSIPLLIVSPIVIAVNARRTIRAACPVPRSNQKQALRVTPDG